MKSWLKYTLRTAAILLTATLLTTSCLQSDFDEPLLAGDTVKVSFNPTLDNNETTRVGEGTFVDKLYAELYLDKKRIGERHVYEVSNGNISGFSMELLKNQTYTIVFWAQNESCGAYDTSDLSKIQITYPGNIDFSDIEEYDAFYAKCDVTVNAKTISDGVDIKLTRPFALVVAGTDEQVETNTTSSLTFSSIATQFDAFTGKASVGAEKTIISFQPKNSTKVPDKEQVMLGIAYVLPMPNLDKTTVTVTTTLDGQSKETGINIPNLTANKRYNLLGSNLVVDAGWGGNYSLLPAVATDGWIHITEAEQLATLLRDGYDNSENEINGIHLCASFNMGGKEIIPTATFKNVIIDGAAYSVNSTYNLDTPIEGNRITEGGGIYELKDLNISGKGVFSSTDTFTARYIKFTNVTVNSTAEAGGVVGTATGSLTLTNITVSGTVTGANKVGGLVGYISNSKGNEATISNCHSTATVKTNNESDKTNHEIFVGGLVGCFSGDTKDEVLTFEGNCSANATGYFTPFCDDEQACFNSDCTVTENLLGGEENCRGSVYYGESRFFYRWDGVRKVTPLTENSSTSIYSPYDLADCQGKSITSMTFHNDVDMGGTDEELEWDGNTIRTTVGVDFARRFTPIKSVKNLTGNNCTIHNLRVQMTHDGSGAGLIQNISGGTVKDLTINKAYIFNDNNWSLGIPSYPKTGPVKDNGEGNAYAGTLTPIASGTTTISNIHVTNGKVFGICKMGGLIGKATDSNDMNVVGCSVEGCILQNYRANVPNYYDIVQSISMFWVTCLGTWYTQGECGGLIGFVQCSKASIDNCKVTNTNINCYGQENKYVYANVHTDLDNSNHFKTQEQKTFFGQTYWADLTNTARAETLIAGRHVNQFIGDVVSQNASEGGTAYTTNITNYEVSGNKYFDKPAENTNNEYNHNCPSFGVTCEVVGCAYYVGVDINIQSGESLGHVKFYAGTLKFQKKNSSNTYTITETASNGDKADWIGGDFINLKTFLSSPKRIYHTELSPIIPDANDGGYSKTDPRSGK